MSVVCCMLCALCILYVVIMCVQCCLCELLCVVYVIRCFQHVAENTPITYRKQRTQTTTHRKKLENIRCNTAKQITPIPLKKTQKIFQKKHNIPVQHQTKPKTYHRASIASPMFRSSTGRWSHPHLWAFLSGNRSNLGASDRCTCV